ncbi:hypothetical protein MBOURGENBZM_18490 [Methanoculleus bourgensis]|nr:hypothetical protein MBOURGENBZM_18490 [Methanoculleus bourgensis]
MILLWAAVRTMMFLVTLVHPPELCLARKEFTPETKLWIDGMDDSAKKLGIKVHGAYSCPTEHALYFVLESDDYPSITAFFSGIMLTNNNGRISPINPLKVSAEILIK